VLKIEYSRQYGSGAMHSRPDRVLVGLTEMNGFMNCPDQRTEDMLVPAGAAVYMSAKARHGVGKTANRFIAYLIELK
jgi:hypothetical protein